jgi:hypothetical protein
MRPSRKSCRIVLTGLLVALGGTDGSWTGHGDALARAKRVLHRGTVDCLRYQSSSNVLTGTVVATREFGPPNYGETPSMDEKVTVPVLKIDHPIRVCPSQRDEAGPDAVQEINTLQIVTRSRFPIGLYGSRIRVNGTLFPAQSGHHYTPVLIWASRIVRVANVQLRDPGNNHGSVRYGEHGTAALIRHK